MSTDTAPFVSQLRARREVHDLAPTAPEGFEIRAQVHEAWDAVRLRVSGATPAAAVKREAIRLLLANTQPAEDYMMKLGGTEIRDETLPLREVGVRAGSLIFVHARRRRPVR